MYRLCAAPGFPIEPSSKKSHQSCSLFFDHFFRSQFPPSVHSHHFANTIPDRSGHSPDSESHFSVSVNHRIYYEHLHLAHHYHHHHHHHRYLNNYSQLNCIHNNHRHHRHHLRLSFLCALFLELPDLFLSFVFLFAPLANDDDDDAFSYEAFGFSVDFYTASAKSSWKGSLASGSQGRVL